MEPTADQNSKESEKREPNIRTMKSDISEFLASTKPSLVQILTTQVEAERAAEEENPKARQTARIFAAVGIILIVGTLGYIGYRYFRPSSSEEAGTLIPQPFFSVDKSITVEYKTGKSLMPSILDNAKVVEGRGTVKRLVVLETSADKKVSQLNTGSFLKAMGIEMPSGIYPALADTLMPLYYRGEFGTRLALVIKTYDPARAFDQLLRNEPELANWWSAIFLGENIPTRIVPFEDRVYKNISYRILALDATRDLQIVYAVFPAKNYLIITSSEEAFRVIINRLFQAS
ncbi:MAG: hypothetical protein HYT39_01095 [Candidatus Sungbacteria bacterium]|nr:hypothetical protein [Candidatus Sungbacteria bacterium]